MKTSGYAIVFGSKELRTFQINSDGGAVPLFDTKLAGFNTADLEVTAGEVAFELQQHGYGGQAILLGLSSHQVLCVQLPEEPNSSRQTGNLALELEEFCPIDAENMCAVTIEDSPNMAWVAIRDRIEPFVNAMSKSGLPVRHLSPVSLLIASTYARTEKVDNRARFRIGLGALSEETILEGSAFQSWRLSRQSGNVDTSLISLAFDSSRGQSIDDDGVTDASPAEPWLARAFHLLSQNQLESQVPEFSELSPGGKRHPLTNAFSLVATATIALMLLSAFAFFLRAKQLDGASADLRRQTEDMYRTVVPNGAKTRLYERIMKAELSKVESQVEIFSDTAQSRDVASNLMDIVANVPGNYSLNFKSIRVTGDRIELNGQARELSDLDTLRNKLVDAGLSLVQSDNIYGKDFRVVCQRNTSEVKR